MRDILGIEASDWLAGKRHWAQFWRFLSRFARISGSAYNEALLLDPELAEQAAEAKLSKLKNPPLFGYSSLHHLLTDIGDILYKQAVKDPSKASLPRPLTAADHLSLSKRQAGMNRTVTTFFPTHAHLTPRLSA